MLSRFFADTRANMAILFAAAMPMLIAVAALAVDEAALYTQQRRLQAAVDLAAIHAAGDPTQAYERARQALIDSGHIEPDIPLEQLRHEAGGPLRVQTGRYVRDTSLAAGERFSPGAGPANAVRVEMAEQGTIYFARTFLPGAGVLRASGLANTEAQAAFSIGSRLARLEGGIANAVLEQFLGTSIVLSLADYEALVSAEIGLLDFLDALAIETGLQAGSYGDVLASTVTLGQIAAAISAASADGTAARIMAGLAGEIGNGITVEMVDLIAADGLAHTAVGAGAGVDAGINALQLLSAAALVADGTHQVSLDLTAGVPGLTGIDVKLAVGEPPQGGWFALGPQGSLVRTAQVRFLIDVSILGDGGSSVLPITVNLPLYAELAFAEAELTALSCPPGRPQDGTATLAVTPGLLRLGAGTMDAEDFLDHHSALALSRAPIATVGTVARVTALAQVEAEQTAPYPVGFGYGDIAAGTVRTVSTTTPVQSLVASLLGNLDLKVEALGVGLLSGTLNGITGTLEALVLPVAPAIESTLQSVLGVLGLSVGEADVRLHGLACRSAVLVQ